MNKLDKNDIGKIYIVMQKDSNYKLFLEFSGNDYGVDNLLLKKFRLLNNYKELYMFYSIKSINDNEYFIQNINLPFDILSYIKKFIS
jgi:hypothetical protein